MLKLREEHFQALRPVAWAQIPHRTLSALKKSGQNAVWDPVNRMIRALDGKGFETRYLFHPDGRPHQVISPSGATTTLEHDDQGRVTAVINPGGLRMEKDYDSRDNVTESRIAGDIKYRYEYDNQNRLIRTLFPDGTTTSYEYDEEGLSSTTDAAGGKKLIRRESKGKNYSITDSLGLTTRYFRTPDGATVCTVFPDDSFIHYAGPERHGSSRTVGRDGRPVFSEWDNQGRLVERNWADGKRLQLTYTPAGKLAAAVAGQDRIQRNYDSAGRLIQEESSQGIVRWGHDANGRTAWISGEIVDAAGFEYDEDGRISVVRDWQGRRALFSYEPDGSIRKISYPNGVKEIRENSSIFQRPSSISLRGANGQLTRGHQHAFDLMGRLVVIQEIRAGIQETTSTRSLEYDSAGRLTKVADSKSRKVLEFFSYDLKGNMILDNGAAVRPGPLDEIQIHGDIKLTYHPRGDLRSLDNQGMLHCEFNADGTLAQVVTRKGLIRFRYDALGRRVLKETEDTSTSFGWAGRQLLWEERRSHQSGVSVRRDYLSLPNSHTPFAFLEHGRIYWMHSDVRGAIIEVTDDSGRSAWRATYDSFGRARIDLDGVHQPWRLCGHYEDDESGLTYTLSRYYLQDLKSFISIDPRWEEDGATNYSYARNDPWNQIDPTGGMAETLTLAAAGPWGWIALGVIAVVGGIIFVSQSKPCLDCVPSIPRVEPQRPPPPPSPCDIALVLCLENPWQPGWNQSGFGPRMDCGACFRECRFSGVWPEYKCPIGA